MSQLLTEEAIYQKTPQEITALLYEACIEALESAKELIEAKKMTEANSQLQKANDILYRLGAGLNYEAGIISDQLDALYNYAAERLIEANIHKDVSVIDEVLKVLQPVAEAWNEAVKKKPGTAQQMRPGKQMAYEQHVLTEQKK